MRGAIIIASLVCATPALGQVRDPVAAARILEDPVAQEGAAMALEQLADILLDTRVDALAALGDGHVRPDDTLREVKRRDDPDFERRLRRDTRTALARAGSVAGGVAAGSAELRRTADRLRAALAPFLTAAKNN